MASLDSLVAPSSGNSASGLQHLLPGEGSIDNARPLAAHYDLFGAPLAAGTLDDGFEGENAASNLAFDYTASDAAPGEEELQQQQQQGLTPARAQAELQQLLRGQLAREQSSGLGQPDERTSALLDADSMSALDADGGVLAGAPMQRNSSLGSTAAAEQQGSTAMDESGSGTAAQGLAFVPMGRGTSNIQAALDDLRKQQQPQHGQSSQRSAAQQASVRQLMRNLRAPSGAAIPQLSQSQQSDFPSQDDYVSQDYGSQSQQQSQSQQADDEHEVEPHQPRLQYDGSLYQHPSYIAAQLGGAGSGWGGSFSGGFSGPPPAQVQQQPYATLYQHHGHGHERHHGHHSHAHSHSVAPKVAAVVEADEVEADETQQAVPSIAAAAVPAAASAASAAAAGASAAAAVNPLAMLDAAYLPHMQPQFQQSHSVGGGSNMSTGSRSPGPHGHSSPYARGHGGRASGGSSPSAHLHGHAHWGGSSVASVPSTGALSPPPWPQLQHHQHSGGVLSPPHAHPAMPTLRSLGRSPSADSLTYYGRVTGPPSMHALLSPPTGSVPAGGLSLARSPSLHSNNSQGSASPSGPGRELHLHPSRQQEQQQALHAHSVQSPPPAHALLQQQAALLQAQSAQLQLQQAQLAQIQQRLHAKSPPQNGPHFGRSFSHEHMHSLRGGAGEQLAYFSDSGLPAAAPASALGHASALPPPASAARFHATGAVPHCATCAAEGSCDAVLLHAASSGVSGIGGMMLPPPGAYAHLVPPGGYTSVSGASSGASTPRRGPASVASSSGGSFLRGSNSMNDLHHLLQLHAESNGAGIVALMPGAAAAGASSSSLAAAAAAAAAAGLAPSPVPSPLSSLSAASRASASVAALSGSPPPERIGAYSREDRARRLERYKAKRARRHFGKRILYQVRKDFAVSRRRVGGRFIKKQNQGCPCADYCLPGCVNYKEEESEAAQMAAAAAAKKEAAAAAAATGGGSKANSRKK